MAINQLYKERRVNELPTSGLSAGDRYYLNVGGGKYQTYIVSDSLQLVKEAGAEFIEKDTMSELRAITAREIWAIQNGYYKGVKLNGYYAKGDTPAPIDYYISSTSASDDGGSVIEVGNIKLEHIFIGEVNALYFGMSNIYSGHDVDNGEKLQKACDYAQRNSPTDTLDIYIPTGRYNFKTGVDMSSNGWTGKLYGDGVAQYSTILQADNSLSAESIHALIYTKYVILGGVRKDRFGRDFLSNGNFEISGIMFAGGSKTVSGTAVDYTTSSVCKYGLDVSSSSYIKINNCVFARCVKGLSASKWHGVIKSNNFRNCTYGLVLSEINDYNTPSGASGDIFSLALNNMVLRENNFSTNKHHVLNPNGAYFLTVKENVFDLSAGSSMIISNLTYVNITNNYFEGNNSENLGHNVSYTGYSGNISENINADIIVYKRSNYNDSYSNLVFEDNQVANNTSNTDKPFLAMSGLTKYSIKDLTFRNYENGGVLFFGNAGWLNQFSPINSKGHLEFAYRDNKNKIKYADNVVNKGLIGLKIIDTSNLNQIYPSQTEDIFDNNLQYFVAGDPSVTQTYKPNLIQVNTDRFSSENYRVNLNSAKYFYSKYDLTKAMRKPSAISVSFDMLAETISSNSTITIQILLDGVQVVNEPIGRYAFTSNPDNRCIVFKPTYILGSSYNTIEIKVFTSIAGEYTIGNFCIRSANLDPYFRNKLNTASTTVKGLVNQATASADTATAPSATYTQAEVQAILTELRDLKSKLRTAGVLAP